MYFDFNEINIMLQNMTSPNREHFIDKIDIMLKNTEDEILLCSLNSLKEKVLTLSEEEYRQIYQEIKLTPEKEDRRFPTTECYSPKFLRH